jgi:hypothetical protein
MPIRVSSSESHANPALLPSKQAQLALADGSGTGRQVVAAGMSCLVHFCLFILLALIVQPQSKGVADTDTRPAGVAVVQNNDGKREFFSPEESPEKSSDEDSAAATALAVAANPLDPPPLDLAGFLPETGDALPTGETLGNALLGSGDLTGKTGGGSVKSGIDGSVTTGVFGAEATGNKFVYVFDRSSSMLGFEGRPLQAAKAELLRSLADLGKTQQFQIVFYNDQPSVFNPFAPQQPRMMFADERGKSDAENFVIGIDGSGGTKHMEAMRLALNMNPDVIFFLTDAAEPQLTASELEYVASRNDRIGATIHTIEFGSGPYRGDDNFLVKLARANRGKHVYVDIARLPNRETGGKP